MLNRSHPIARHQERGVVMIIALIVLVALILGSLALTKSVFTSNLIAGNLSFQKAATNSADLGVENAIAWLEQQNGKAGTCDPGTKVLACDHKANGYLAVMQNPVAGQSWSDFWDKTLVATNAVKTLSADGADNTSAYVIQRMCSAAGDSGSTGVFCSTSPNSSGGTCASGSSCDTQGINLYSVSQVYYRVTVRVQGPNHTVSFVQAMVAM
ncbi:hypothetical protein HS961_23060 [Comamonas piscis]|uniref:Pilus assembly protein PilX n=1 Tax=Comamonas piscis TaxID=1562974 RepID=A0A7G5ENA1_9BURK|nr:hypothetical protein [Comamonas piscis]QMV75476.1 hypothetical protein HS961_23060 [Comamonas piscis]WSO33986.1 hypothetical protein VUJ63_23125 [Comamonas piscis]